MLRLSADVGGTFTDLVLIDDDSGQVWIEKVSSTPGSAEAIVLGIDQIAAKAEVSVSDIGMFLHGFTIATNAWLTRSGADVLLLVTEGYRDILEIGDQRRPDLYNLATQKPRPILDRNQVVPVRERMDAFGQPAVALTEAEISRVVDLVANRSKDSKAGGPQAIAISLLFSFLNAAHELQLATALQARFPQLPVYLSSRINPKIHEYARTNTTAAAAYVGPAVHEYTTALEKQVSARGLSAQILYMRSDGGTSGPDDTRANPANMLLSGPAGGVVAGVQTCRLLDIDNLVTFDMGGTSADFSVIASRDSSVARSRQVDGLPLRLPTLDIKAISAGGGSIARVDAGGALRVGPGSAGSTPGPAAYGRGGTDATVTDALLVLGYLDAGSFADPSIQLAVANAEAAISKHVATPLNVSVTDAALGIVSVATANMAGATRVISTERGHDLREFALLAFGGAGSVFAPFLLRELQLNEILVPPAPGVFAALGLQFADVRHDAQIAFTRPLADVTATDIQSALDEPILGLQAKLRDGGFASDASRFAVSADMRYLGQHHELNLDITDDGIVTDAMVQALAEQFSDTHDQAYGYCDRDAAIEVTGLRVDAIGALSKPDIPLLKQSAVPATPVGTRPVYLEMGRSAESANIYRRSDLSVGQTVTGPAVIEQADTTTLLLARQQALVTEHGFLRITDLPGTESHK